MPNSEHPNDYGSAVGTRDGPSLFAVLRRRAWIIVAVALLTGATAGAYAYLNKETYESTAKLLFTQNVGSGAQLAPVPVPGAGRGQPGGQQHPGRGLPPGGRGHCTRPAAARGRHLRRRRGARRDRTGEKDSEVVAIVATDDSARGAAQLAQAYARQASRIVSADGAARARRVLDSVDEQLVRASARAGCRFRRGRLRGAQERLRALGRLGRRGARRSSSPAYAPSE